MRRDEVIDDLRRAQSLPDLIWIERPTLLHGRATKAGVCKCGCGSQSGSDPSEFAATLIETIPGPILIIDRITGQRKYRDTRSDGTPRTPEEIAKFDALKPECEFIYLPRRCYPKQLEAIKARPKVKGIFGGVRGGKTEALAEEAVDVWVEFGGRGVHLWWVAPLMADCLRAVTKLVSGQAIRGGATPEVRPAKFPASLIFSAPSGTTERQLEQIKRRKPIVMIDGTVIGLRYAKAGSGAPLKGDNVVWIGIDEGAEIEHANVLNVLIQRVTDSGGWVSTATTPKVNSPLKQLVYDEGTELSAANDNEYLTGWAHLSMRDNPWIRPADVERAIATLLLQPNGEDLVKQDIDGQWIVPGQRFWEHWAEDVHLVEGPWRSIENYQVDGRKLVDITADVAEAFFTDSPANFDIGVGGQDFNGRGNVTEVVDIGCPEDLDRNNPDNWVFFVKDEVVKRGEPYTAARWLAKQAGAMRGLPANHYERMAIACDPEGAQEKPPDSEGAKGSYSKADAFIRMGFDMRSCHTNDNGKVTHPGKVDSHSVVHMLMRRRDLGQDAGLYPNGKAANGAPPRTRLLVHKQRCPKLVRGFREQADSGKGFPRKERSGDRDDQLSDAVDAFRYLGWALLSEAEFYPRLSVVGWDD